MFSKKLYFRYLSYFISALVFLPVFTNNLPPMIGSFHLYAAIWLSTLLLFEPKVYIQKMVLYFLLFGLFFTIILPLLIWTSITDWNLNAIRVEFYSMVVPITILGYFQLKKDFKGLATFVKLSIFFILITGVMTLYSASIDPMYARMMGAWYDAATTNYFKKLGGGTYGYVGALIGIFPVLIYFWRNNNLVKYSKRTILTSIVFLFFVVITMQFFGNILISTMFITLSLTSVKKLKQTIISLSIVFIIAITIPSGIYASVLKSTAELFPSNSENYKKMVDMAMYIETGNEGTTKKEGRTAGRSARYPELLETFLYNPILGAASNNTSTYNQAGGHLYWMNRLAVFGIIGFAMMLLYQRYYLKSQLKYYNESYTVYFLLASFAILSYGLIKAIAGREIWFMYFIIIPGAYYLPLLNKKKNVK